MFTLCGGEVCCCCLSSLAGWGVEEGVVESEEPESIATNDIPGTLPSSSASADSGVLGEGTEIVVAVNVG